MSEDDRVPTTDELAAQIVDPIAREMFRREDAAIMDAAALPTGQRSAKISDESPVPRRKYMVVIGKGINDQFGMRQFLDNINILADEGYVPLGPPVQTSGPLLQVMVVPSLAGPSGIRDGDIAAWGYGAVRSWDVGVPKASEEGS